MTSHPPRAVARSTKFALGGAVVGLALVTFLFFRVDAPGRRPEAGDADSAPRPRRHLPDPGAKPVWQTRLRDIARDHDPTRRANALQQLAEAISIAQMKEAIGALQAEEEATPAAQLRLLLLRRWADHLPTAAAAWLAELPAAGHQIADCVSVGYGLAQNVPASAVALAERLPPGQAREGLLLHAVQQWAANDPVKAVAWANSRPDQKARDEFLTVIAVEWAAQEPALAAAFATSALTAGRPRDAALLQIADSWARAAPEQAADWIIHLPASEGEVRDFAVGQLMAAWARKDLVKTADWLIGLPEGTTSNVAVSVYVPILAETEPDLAVQWLETIQDSDLHAVIQERLRNM